MSVLLLLSWGVFLLSWGVFRLTLADRRTGFRRIDTLCENFLLDSNGELPRRHRDTGEPQVATLTVRCGAS
jgi:hypothetical protein